MSDIEFDHISNFIQSHRGKGAMSCASLGSAIPAAVVRGAPFYPLNVSKFIYYTYGMMEAWQHEKGQLHDEKVDRFLDAHPNITFKSINVGGKTVILFEERGLDLTDFALIETILKKQRAVEREGIVDNCYFIALDAVDDGVADGVVAAKEGASKVINFHNHAVNVKQLADGSYLVMDFTAPENQDLRRGIFKTFCIHAKEKESILTMLSEFHGGEWTELSEEMVQKIRSFNRRKVA